MEGNGRWVSTEGCIQFPLRANPSPAGNYTFINDPLTSLDTFHNDTYIDLRLASGEYSRFNVTVDIVDWVYVSLLELTPTPIDDVSVNIFA